MLSTRLIKRPSHTHGTAAIARQRLMTDRSMRRATQPARVNDEMPVASPTAVALPRFPMVPGRTDPTIACQLSPAEQRQSLLQVAASFQGHYLAKITYLHEYLATVATVRPRVTRGRNGVSQSDQSYHIVVDAGGNVSITNDSLQSNIAARGSIPLRVRITIGIMLLSTIAYTVLALT